MDRVMKLYYDGQLVLNSKQPADVTVWDVAGRKCLSTRLSVGCNVISTLPKGIYYIMKGV